MQHLVKPKWPTWDPIPARPISARKPRSPHVVRAAAAVRESVGMTGQRRARRIAMAAVWPPVPLTPPPRRGAPPPPRDPPGGGPPPPPPPPSRGSRDERPPS